MRLLPSSLLGRFVLRILLFLPFWFALWYYSAGVVLMPAVWMSQWTLNLLHPGLIENVMGLARNLQFVTSLEVPVQDAPPGSVGQVVVGVNALVYSWNIPVLLAMLFAADERFFSYSRFFGSFLGLLPLHMWGISFEVMKTLTLQSGPHVQAQLGVTGWQLDLIALGYQFGYLMLPVIGAATLWILMNGSLLQVLLGNQGLMVARPNDDRVK